MAAPALSGWRPCLPPSLEASHEDPVEALGWGAHPTCGAVLCAHIYILEMFLLIIS